MTRRAFSIVELLVTIVIINVLLALLLPAIAAARNEARKIACASQLRQTGVALRVYMDTRNDGVLPAVHAHETRWRGVPGPHPLTLYPLIFSDGANSPDGIPLEQGTPYLGGEPVDPLAECPSDPENARRYGTSRFFNAGHLMLSAVGLLDAPSARTLTRSYESGSIAEIGGADTQAGGTVLQDYSLIDRPRAPGDISESYHDRSALPRRDNSLMWDGSVAFRPRSSNESAF